MQCVRVFTGVACVIVRLSDAVSMWTDPLATALTDDRHQLCITAVRPRWCSIFLWTQRRAGVRAVLTCAQQTAVRLELFAIFICFAVDVAWLGGFCCSKNHTVCTCHTLPGVCFYLVDQSVCLCVMSLN